MSAHVAVDIGASSGRVIVAKYEDNHFEVSEVHRFKNGFQQVDGHDRWNIDDLFQNILMGLAIVKECGIEECTLGIDTWAVDYVLVKDGEKLGHPIAYRDSRTQKGVENVFAKITKEELYSKTGIQFLPFNTVFQYAAEGNDVLRSAEKSLLIPDYLAYQLTGVMVAEETNASTTQLLNLHHKTYDVELLEIAGVTPHQLPELVAAGTYIGDVTDALRAEYDLPATHVFAVATHDTASAVVGVPATNERFAYISSGTWSLIGTELKEPLITEETQKQNYTNEWGAYETIRFLKNITGMWSIQEIARMLDYQYSYQEMADAAKKVAPFEQFVDLNDDRFTNPQNMIEEIQAYCKETNQKVPETVGELTMCVYSNLAFLYAHELEHLERLTGHSFDVIHIVGGGSNVSILNQLTATVTGKTVVAGPGEATALGNLLVQMIADGKLESLQHARQFLREQIELNIFEPEESKNKQILKQWKQITERGKNHD